MSSFAALPIEEKLGLATWAALTLLQVLWHAWWFPPQSSPPALVLALAVVPLLLPLFAWRNVTRTLIWVGMLSLVYFCHGVAEAWAAPAERIPAVVEIMLTVGLIALLGIGVRQPRKR